MDMLANFNKAMEYIETHLEEEIDFNMVSKIAEYLNITLERCFRIYQV